MKNRVHLAPRHRAALLAVGVSLVPGAFAQSVSAPPPGDAIPMLATTTVTATRIESRADEVLADLVVIDRAAIEVSGARTLPELLAREAGLQSASNGGPGQAASLFTRGSSGRHTLLLVDGVRVNSLYTGAAPWETIPVETIDRIEVLKGPASALYGPDAAGGVVQVFTRQGREGLQGQVALTAGSLGYGRAAGSIQGGNAEGLRYALGVQQMAERGISATSPNAGNGSHTNVPYTPDRDGMRQSALNGSLRLPLNRDWRVDASMLYSNGVTRTDEGPGIDSRSAVRSAVARAGLTGKVSPGWQTELTLGRSEDTHDFIATLYYTPVRSIQQELTWQNTLDTRAGLLLLGTQLTQQDLKYVTADPVNPAEAHAKRETRSVFAGLNGQKGMSSWQVNARRDQSDQFGDRNTGLAAYGLQFAPEWRASASWGQTFVAPSFGDLYDYWMGNTTLKPEHGVNREVSLDWSRPGSQAKLTRFDNRIVDLLAYSSGTGHVENVGAARLRGWTLSGRTQWAGFNLRGSLDQLDPRDETTGKVLIRRATHQASLGLDRRQGDWRWGGSVLHVGQRFDDDTNTATYRLPPYTTLDLFGEWRFARDLDLQVKLNNATNRQYQTAYGFGQPGRVAYLTLRWQTR